MPDWGLWISWYGAIVGTAALVYEIVRYWRDR